MHSGFFNTMRSRRPVAAPFYTAIYSDAGYSLLGYVLSRLAGASYGSALDQLLATPLGLRHTAVDLPRGGHVNGLAIPGARGVETSWGYDNEVSVG